MGRGTRAAMLTTALAGASAILGAPVAAAQTSDGSSWNCRASLAYVAIAGLDRVEPVVANGNVLTNSQPEDRPSCASDDTALPSIDITTPLKVALQTPRARTVVTDETGPTKVRQNFAGAIANDTAVGTPDGSILVTADAVSSVALASCVNGVPTLNGASGVVGLAVNGTPIPIDSGLAQITTVVNGSPLSMLVRVLVNEQLRTGDANSATQTLRQTAARVELLNIIGGQPLVTVALGETKVSRSGSTCLDPSPPPTTTVTQTETTTTTTPGPTTTQTVPGPTTTTTVPGPTTTVTAPTTGNGTGTTTGSGSGGTTIALNGVNGGCGKLTMYFAKNRKKALGARFAAERVVTRGRIVSCTNKSIRGARIDVFHVLPGGTKRIVKTGLRSRELGRLTLILPRNLFTRKLVFEYRGNLNSSKVTSRQTLQINVRDKAGKLIKSAPKGQGKPRF